MKESFFGLLVLSLGPTVFAQSAEQLEQVVVLGTRRTDVTALESSAPVDVVGAEELQRSGYSNASQALAAVVPSFVYPMSNFGAGSSANRSGALRGLSPDQTLVLVNGKRRYASAWVNNKFVYGRGSQAVDLNAIPVAAIERIEVLRDGASAQYGSDAIAGVINLVLKSEATGGVLNAEYSGFTKGDGEQRKVSGWKGLSLGEAGFLTLSAEASSQNFTNSERGPDLRQYYFPGDPREATAPRYWKRGAPESDLYNVVVNGELLLTDTVTAYAFGNWGHREVRQMHPYRPPSGNDVVRAIFPDGYQPFSDTKGDDAGLTLGLRHGETDSGQFDLSATYGRNKLTFYTRNSLNPSYGLASPTDFYVGTLENEQFVADLAYTRELAVGFLESPITFASGVSYRKDKFIETAGDEASWRDGGERVLDGPNAGAIAPAGAQSFPGQTDQDAGTFDRDVYAAYLSLESQVTDQLSLGLAGRAEEYSDFGSTVTGKLSARYDFTPGFALRTTIGTGFRAPTVGQIGFSSSQMLNSYVSDERVQYRTLPPSNPAARALGATDLKAEKSDNLAVGFVLRPFADLSLTVDYYYIKVKDRIALSENLTGAYVQSVLADAGYPTVFGASYFTNAVDTKTEGVDVVGRYDVRLPAANQALSLTASFNYTRTRITEESNPLQPLGLTLIGRQARGLIEEATPETTLNLAAHYSVGAFSAALSAKRFGKYAEYHQNNPDLDQVYSPQWVVDAAFTYSWRDRIDITVGANNLFDSYPDQSIAARANYRNGKSEYSNLSPAGFDGRAAYGKVTVRF
jgi:iron complex outermembrane receptor protein